MSQKYSYNNEFVNTIGGGDVLIDVFKKQGILGFINKHLGSRSARAEYDYGEAIMMWFVSVCSGLRRGEHLYNYKENFKRHPRFNKFISPDTFYYMCKELAVKNKYYEKTKKPKDEDIEPHNYNTSKDHEVNWNDKLTDLLIDTALKLGLIKQGVKYVLDYDTTIIKTKIKGSRPHYQGGGTGYAPALALINNIPLVIENRNGDSNGSFHLTITIKKILSLLNKRGIIVDTVRVDGAGFNREFTNYMDEKGMKYFTRPHAKTVDNVMGDIFNWRTTTFRGYSMEIGDGLFDFGRGETRMIVERRRDGTKWGVITNDMEISDELAITLYAKRGDAENLFKDLKGHFGWNILPMRELNYNCVYLYIQALCFSMFTYMKRKFSKVMLRVRANMTLRTFRDKFMNIPTKWNGEELVFLSDLKDYIALSGFT